MAAYFEIVYTAITRKIALGIWIVGSIAHNSASGGILFSQRRDRASGTYRWTFLHGTCIKWKSSSRRYRFQRSTFPVKWHYCQKQFYGIYNGVKQFVDLLDNKHFILKTDSIVRSCTTLTTRRKSDWKYWFFRFFKQRRHYCSSSTWWNYASLFETSIVRTKHIRAMASSNGP